MIIYKATNLKNNKVYIGQTINSLEYRRNQHFKDCKRIKYYNNYFHNALIKYGISAWKWEILEECNSIEKLNELEIYYIKLYDSTNKEKGYNLKYGGKNGGKCSEETKKKIGLTTKEKWQNPEIAYRMKEGLVKATETWKEKAKTIIDHRICPYCGNDFICKPFESKKYCSIDCANKALSNNKDNTKRLCDGTAVIYNKIKNQQLEKINIWIKNNIELFKNIKFNNLKFLNNLCTFLNVKDPRTVAKYFNLNSKKLLVKKLIEISKNIC